MRVILCTNHCPCCEALERGLKAAAISYEVVTDVPEMVRLGITHVPRLSVDGAMMSYLAALAWLKERMEASHADH